jgi:hypothetical protein
MPEEAEIQPTDDQELPGVKLEDITGGTAAPQDVPPPKRLTPPNGTQF